MHRVIIQYDQEPDATAYEAHAEVCRKVPGAAFRHGKVFGSPFGASPHAYYAEWEFADKAAFDAGLASPEFGATLQDLDDRGLARPVSVEFAELA